MTDHSLFSSRSAGVALPCPAMITRRDLELDDQQRFEFGGVPVDLVPESVGVPSPPKSSYIDALCCTCPIGFESHALSNFQASSSLACSRLLTSLNYNICAHTTSFFFPIPSPSLVLITGHPRVQIPVWCFQQYSGTPSEEPLVSGSCHLVFTFQIPFSLTGLFALRCVRFVASRACRDRAHSYLPQFQELQFQPGPRQPISSNYPHSLVRNPLLSCRG